MVKAVAYYRVSTEKQGKSGLGLEAQKEMIGWYKQIRNIDLVQEFTEVESGRKSKRPVLAKALNYCRKHNTLLVIAKLDRLSRNVAFISSLMESKVQFVAADNPQASELVLHIYAAFAQHEAREISIRTKSALQAAKKRGVQLGKNGHKLAEQNKKASADFVSAMKPVIQAMKKEGFVTVQAITDELNGRKVSPFRKGAKWHKSRVHKLLTQLN